MLLKSGAKKPAGQTLAAPPTSHQDTGYNRYSLVRKSFERQGAKPIKSVERAPTIGSIEGDDSIAEDEEDDTWLKPKSSKAPAN